MLGLKIMYCANILVTGWISITSLFYPKTAQATVFQNTVAYSETIRLVGALWGAIFILSILGLFWPRQMSVIFLFQFIYKLSWLMVVVLPAILNRSSFPTGVAITSLIWIVIVPFIIPWKELFG